MKTRYKYLQYSQQKIYFSILKLLNYEMEIVENIM